MNRPNYVNCLPGVPSVESPFFDELFDKASPYYSTAVALRDNGFAVVDFPDPDLDVIIERIKADLTAQYPWSEWNDGANADMRIMDAWRQSADVRRVATNAQMRELVSYLYGREAFPFQTLNFPVGTQQHFHSDAVHFSSLPERFMCGVWLAMEDIGSDQGPLLYYPGSHKWPIYTRQHIGQRYVPELGRHQSIFEPLWESLVVVHDIEPVRFYPKKGQALIWAANLLHGGDRHKRPDLTRWSQVTHYYFDDCVYFTPLASNEPEGDLFERHPTDIMTAFARPSSYLGKAIDPEHDISIKSFDPVSYLAKNPDVAAAGVDPWQHYNTHGRAENRVW